MKMSSTVNAPSRLKSARQHRKGMHTAPGPCHTPLAEAHAARVEMVHVALPMQHAPCAGVHGEGEHVWPAATPSKSGQSAGGISTHAPLIEQHAAGMHGSGAHE